MVRVKARACVGDLLVSPALEMSGPHYPILHRNTAHSTGQLTDRVVPVQGEGVRRVNARHGCVHPSRYTHESSNKAELIVLTWPKDG